MKKMLLLACMTLGMMSCEKDPDFGQMDANLVVYTDHDNNVDFGKYQTYFLPDSILEIGGYKATYWKDENAMQLISKVEQYMNERGYTRLTEPEQKEDANIGLQLSYLAQSTQIVTGGYWNHHAGQARRHRRRRRRHRLGQTSLRRRVARKAVRASAF